MPQALSPPARRRPRGRALAGALGIAFAAAALAGESASDAESSARGILERMVSASRTLNYDGTFVYRNGDTMQSMRIIHRGEAEGERERLVSLSGAPREVLRDSRRVTCILPDDEAVVVAKARKATLARSRLFDPDLGMTRDLARTYRLAIAGSDRVAGRDTAVVTVAPRDRFRYGYRLSVDRDTGLLLKSELLDATGAPVEQIVYTTIDVPTRIPDSLLEPDVSGAGFTVYSAAPDDGEEAGGVPGASAWRIDWLPDGFALSDAVDDPVRPSRMPVEHRVYTDGLATVSVFIERLAEGAERLEGPSAMGAVHAFGTVIDGFQVTAVGEVPLETVERVAASVRRAP